MRRVGRSSCGIPQERTRREIALGVAVDSLKHELELAVRLLYQVKIARETLAIETEAIGSAREAFLHASSALGRMPQIEAHDMRIVQGLMDDLRGVLAEVG